MEVRFVDASLLRPLRHSVLRANLPFETTSYEGDNLDTTRHAAVFADSEEPIAIGTIMAQPYADEPLIEAFQLRGMAVSEKCRGTGAGKLALEALEEAARDSGAALIWCKARSTAANFYKKAGWVIVSDEFELPQFGPHFIMLKRLK